MSGKKIYGYRVKVYDKNPMYGRDRLLKSFGGDKRAAMLWTAENRSAFGEAVDMVYIEESEYIGKENQEKDFALYRRPMWSAGFHGYDELDVMIKEGALAMDGFMTKKELEKLFEDGIKFGVVKMEPYHNVGEMAQAQFEGELAIGLDALEKLIEEKRKEYGKEYSGTYALKEGNQLTFIKVQQFQDGVWVCLEKKENGRYTGFKLADDEERFQKMLVDGYEKTNMVHEVGKVELNDLDGFSHEEAVAIVMDAIAAGVIRVRHDQIYPYTYGFEMFYNGMNFKPKGNPFTMAESFVTNMELGKEEHEIFGSRRYRYADISLKKLKEEIDIKKRDGSLSSYTPYETTMEYKRHQKHSWDRGLIANDKHIDNGYGLDGIIQGHCGGDYSSMTTNSQNEWMRAAVALRGYCLDYVVRNKRFPWRDEILQYHAEKGLDVRNPEVLKKWCEENPGLCEDRESAIIDLDKQIEKAKEQLQKVGKENRNFLKEEKERIQINGKAYNLSFDCDGGSGADYLKWHNFSADSVSDPENDFYEIQICQEIGEEPFFYIEVFEKDETGDYFGEWKDLDDIIKNPDEIKAIQDVLIDWSDEIIEENEKSRDDSELIR